MSCFAQNSPMAPPFTKKETKVLPSPFWLPPPSPSPNCLFIFISFMLPFAESLVATLILWFFQIYQDVYTLGTLHLLSSAGKSRPSMIPSLLPLSRDHTLPPVWGLPWPDHVKLQLVHSDTPNSHILSSFFLYLALSSILIIFLTQSQIILFNNILNTFTEGYIKCSINNEGMTESCFYSSKILVVINSEFVMILLGFIWNLCLHFLLNCGSFVTK